MLILSRKTNQVLVIGDSIEITVVEIRDGHVRLGVNAPKYVPVHRKELLDAVTAENIAAAASVPRPDESDVSGAIPNQPVVAALTQSGQAAQSTKGG